MKLNISDLHQQFENISIFNDFNHKNLDVKGVNYIKSRFKILK